MWKRTLGLVLASAATAAAPACSCGDDAGETGGGTSVDAAANGSNATGTAQGNPSGQGGNGDGGGTAPTVTVAGPGGGDPSGQGGTGGACADITINFEPVIPSVMLLIDQSGSMDEGFGDDGSRWDVLYETLMDPDNGVVTQLQDKVRFGVSLYTGGNSCPAIIDVPIALNNRDAIDAVYEPEGPEGDTPTGDSITAVTPGVVAFGEPGPKFIVLCTDGEPDTCEDGDADGRPEATAAAVATFNQDIGIYVISVGSEIGDEHLQDMANAGVGLPFTDAEDEEVEAPFWKALDAEGLADAFDEIINGVRSCVLTVDGEIDPEKACDGTVRVDGEEIPCDDPDGWKLNSPTEIELQGDACDLIQSGDHTVDATFPCEAAETSGTGVPA